MQGKNIYRNSHVQYLQSRTSLNWLLDIFAAFKLFDSLFHASTPYRLRVKKLITITILSTSFEKSHCSGQEW